MHKPFWTMLICALAGASSPAFAADAAADTAREILAMERRAMDGWRQGNPDPALAVSDPAITYFHVMTDQRLDGLPAVRALYENFRGTPLFDSYEMVDPKVQSGDDFAVLTYILVRHNGSATGRFNATLVYQRKKEGWRVIHSHFSMTRPPLPAAP